MNLWFNHTTLKVLLGTSLLGLAAGIVGVLLMLKKQALLGDALSHTVLPGIVISYLIMGEINNYVFWLGAIGASLISLFLLEIIHKYSIIKSDTALVLILASFFGLGHVLIAQAQKNTKDNSIAVLEKFILGQPALISTQSVILMALITLITVLIVTALWKEFKIFIFDEKFTETIGFNTKIIKIIFNLLLISIICISLKIIGIILTSAFLIIPGVITRQFSDKLFMNVVLASFVTFFASFIGTMMSNHIENMPTGPIIIVIATIFVLLTFLFAPKYGITRKMTRQKKYKNLIYKFKKLIHFYYYENQNLLSHQTNSFLIQEKYLILQQNKLQITTKGILLVEKLINGIIH